MNPYLDRLCDDYEAADNSSNSDKMAILNEFTYNSKCFVSSVINPNFSNASSTSTTRCHLYSCSADKETITITSSYLNEFKVVCGPSDQGIVKNAIYNDKPIGKITCPDYYQKFCDN